MRSTADSKCELSYSFWSLSFFEDFLLYRSAFIPCCTSPMRHLWLTGFLKQQVHHHYHHHHASKDLYRLFHPEDSKKKTDKDEEKKVSSEIFFYLALFTKNQG